MGYSGESGRKGETRRTRSFPYAVLCLPHGSLTADDTKDGPGYDGASGLRWTEIYGFRASQGEGGP